MKGVKYPRPSWVIEEIQKLRKQHKGKGTIEVKFVHGTWQVRLAWSVWDKEKKKPVKKEKYLGVLKEGIGFLPKRRSHKKKRKKATEKVKEGLWVEVKHLGWENEWSYVWGADRVGREALRGVWDMVDNLFEEEEASVIKALSLTWGVWGVLPLKSVYRQWNRMWSRREFGISLQPNLLSEVLAYIGRRPQARYRLGAWLCSLDSEKPLLFDMTHLFTWSERIDSACWGWNAERKWLPQVRIGIVSSGERPALMEMTGGNLHEIPTLTFIQEALSACGVQKPLIWVADRGCASSSLAVQLVKQNQLFVLPLRKNMVEAQEYRKEPEAYFSFCKRRIGWREVSQVVEDRTIRLLLFHDPVLGGYQVNTYRARYMEEGKQRAWLWEKEQSAGWIALWTNTDLSAQEVFEIYKMRQHVEEVVDRFRNHLLAEGSFMREDEKLLGWLWVVLLALQVHWFLLDRLRQAGLLKRWSVEEVLRELREIRQEPTPAGWRLTPVPQSTRNLLEKLKLAEIIWA